MEKIFLLLVGSEHIRNPWRNIYIPIILDVFVWNGSCLLAEATNIDRRKNFESHTRCCALDSTYTRELTQDGIFYRL